MAKKIIDIENRIPELARRKKRRFYMQIGFIAFVLLLLIVILIYRQSPLSHIQEIDVTGEAYKTADYHMSQMPFQLGDSMWFNVSDAEQQILENDWIKEVTVERKWLTTVAVTLKEYAHVGYIERDNSYYAILENGDIVEEPLTSFVMDAPLLSKFKDDAYLNEMLEQLASLKPEVHALISEVVYTPSESDKSVVTLYMTDGYEVRALIHEFAKKVNYYPDIVAQLSDIEMKGVIDLEVGSYFSSFDSEYGVRIDESTYIDEEQLNTEQSTEQESDTETPDEQSSEDVGAV